MNKKRFEELKQDFLPRFWDTKNNVMIYPELMATNGWVATDIEYQIIYKVGDKNLILDSMLSNNRFKEMKPYGLHDKKHNLIYVGDIVKEIPNGHISEVKYDVSCGFYMEPEYEARDLFELWERSRLLIIGNVHTDKGV